MDYDSESSCEGGCRVLPEKEDPSLPDKRQQDVPQSQQQKIPEDSVVSAASRRFGTSQKLLSAQVMEYYHRYAQNSNLDLYFSLPATTECTKYYYNIHDVSCKSDHDKHEDRFSLHVPRERRRWARPPLIGQSYSTDSTAICRDSNAWSLSPRTIVEERNESQEIHPDNSDRKTSPTSSIASHKPLEWDSGADVGYCNTTPSIREDIKKLSTIERMALARGRSAVLRLDPEGTTESAVTTLKSRPEATSTPLAGNVSDSGSEIEITPIMKHLPGIITGEDICIEKNQQTTVFVISETPKSSTNFKAPQTLKDIKESEGDTPSLKKSTSMNQLTSLATNMPLKKSQSDIDLCAKNKATSHLIFHSTSSIATVVNKPSTCDKVIQTSMTSCAQESIGVQVSVLEENEKPPLPKRGTSLTQRTIHSILKPAKCMYKVQSTENSDAVREKTSSSESSRATPQVDEPENVTGRANSFEYFPGHIYENVPNGSSSHISSVDTARSNNSTMPNTSSSIDEKLWGDSDSIARDLEQSVKILKSLFQAKKCDKQVKKRLIHHVVKRLVTANYTDDKIEHNLEENIPWNPDDARNKVYRRDIIQALAKNTTDSSDDWKPSQKKKSPKKTTTEARAMKNMIHVESSTSDKFDRNTDRTVMDGRKARMGLRIDDCDQTSSNTAKSESSECFLPQCNFKSGNVKNAFSSSSSSMQPDQNRALLDAVVNNRRINNSSHEPDNSPDWRVPTTMSERRYELRQCSNSDSGDSKLVSYAEMEKKNQLIWITNEISHLSNLKKLLEQPKKLDRPKTSPRKVKSMTFKSRPTISNEESQDRFHEQWSSHCNLSNCQPVTNTGVIKRIKTKNSCTQTATETLGAHSKTGSEIISASRIQNQEKKLATNSTQTSQLQSNSTQPPSNPLQCTVCTCPVHQTIVKSTACTFGDHLCLCMRQATEQYSKDFYEKGHISPLFSLENSHSSEGSRGCKCYRNYGNGFQSEQRCTYPIIYPKPVAYELSFTKEQNAKNVKESKTKCVKIQTTPLLQSPVSQQSESCKCKDKQSQKPDRRKQTLQECLVENKSEFINNVEMRQQFMNEILQLREMRKEKRIQLLSMATTSEMFCPPRPIRETKFEQRKITDEEMKERKRKRYFRLTEVKARRLQQEREEEARRNKMMANIFGKKLQQKALKGQVDLSPSVSVISNI